MTIRSLIVPFVCGFLTGTAILFGLLVAVAMPARAHSFYPPVCCGGGVNGDCAPVDQAVAGYPEGSGIVVTSIHGTVHVPEGFETRPSQDSRMHVCQRKNSKGDMYPICFFLPPTQ